MTEIEIAMNTLRNAMNKDHDYAWGWHCNMAVMAMDAGAEHNVANDGAARFMKLAFDIDVTQFPEYKENVK